MKKLLLTVLLSLTFLQLQGCAAGIIVLAGTAVAVTNDERTFTEQLDDSALSRNAAEKVEELNIPADDLRISFITNSGYLLVVGQVGTTQLKQAIEKQLNTLDNLNGVYNQLRIGKPIGFAQQSKDSWITTKVKSQFTAHDDINPLKIKIVTENAEVFLIGKVSEQEAKDATNFARKVDGVKRVNRVFQFVKIKTDN